MTSSSRVDPFQPSGSDPPAPEGENVLVIGGGPAGLTAAYQLQKYGVSSTVLEADRIVGGISRTEMRDGYRFDLGGHRFLDRKSVV